jgi:hypothetical protein
MLFVVDEFIVVYLVLYRQSRPAGCRAFQHFHRPESVDFVNKSVRVSSNSVWIRSVDIISLWEEKKERQKATEREKMWTKCKKKLLKFTEQAIVCRATV